MSVRDEGETVDLKRLIDLGVLKAVKDILAWTVDARVPIDISGFILTTFNEAWHVETKAFGDPAKLAPAAKDALAYIKRVTKDPAPKRDSN